MKKEEKALYEFLMDEKDTASIEKALSNAKKQYAEEA